ncbi:hypothetical protein G6F43_001628 [Rhizopus delemar]|nr:hypothetical protein G6F43_001628 [Rhizopus delemar]
MVNLIYPFALGLLASAVQANIVKEVDPKTIETRGLGAFFVEFYKTNNLACQNFAPQYEELASVHQGDGVSFGRINCDDYSQYCQEKGVNGDDLPALLTSLHLNPWKIYKGDFVSLDTVDQFIRDNKPFRNTEGQSKSITSSEELKAITENKEPWFIKFYAPWCGHCKNLAPEWIQVANRLKNRVNVGEVNCDANKDLCNEYQISGLPTLKYFVHGTSIQYYGERVADPLVEFAMDYSNTAVRGVRRDEAFDDLLKKNDVNLIYVTENKEKKDIERLERIAPSYLQSLPFYTTMDPKTTQRLGLTQEQLPAITILKDGHQFVYNNEEDLASWIEKHSKPLVTSIQSHNSNQILRKQHGTVVLGLFATDDLDSLKALRKLAAECTEDDVLFAYLDSWAYANFVSRMYGISVMQLPAVVLLQPQQQQYYKFIKDQELFNIAKAPQEILNALRHLDTLTPISTAPSKAIGVAGKIVDFIQQYWVLFSGGFFVLLVGLTILISTSETSQPVKKSDLKKE